MTILAAVSVTANAQSYPRRASIVGGGGGNGGKCTIEVVVDGAAEVQINGDTATLNNISGRPPEWRRFECTGRMPPNPGEFRFQGRDGRGRQQLVRDPRGGGPAVIRIDDPDNGAEGYTFDITWGGGQGYGGPGLGVPNDQRRNDYPDRDRDRDRAPAGRFSPDQAISVCRDEVKLRAAERFGTPDIEFRDMRLDDNPGRGDWIVGSFFLRRDRDRDQAHRFTCSVNFDNGQVRSVQIDQNGQDRDRGFTPGPDRAGVRDAVQTCRRAAEDRVRERGYRDVEFGRINVDDRPGRQDWVLGTLRAGRGGNWEPFEFSCRVDLRDGDVKSVDLTRR
jgi:hypothetical protein